MAVDHYENFPVASFLLPASQRRAVVAIYRFARAADDIADEGDAPADERLAALDAFAAELDCIAAGRVPANPLFAELAIHVAARGLPVPLFRDLLDAFRQDVTKDRYADEAELLDYCRRSANPVGRLLLHLAGQATDAHLRCSDDICTALQLINHWQDVAIDLQKGVRGRIYLPQADLDRFGVDEAELMRRPATTVVCALVVDEARRARDRMLRGAALGWALPGRFGMEIRAIVAGGLRVADKIIAVGGDVFARRPVLTAADWPCIAWRTLVRPLSP